MENLHKNQRLMIKIVLILSNTFELKCNSTNMYIHTSVSYSSSLRFPGRVRLLSEFILSLNVILVFFSCWLICYYSSFISFLCFHEWKLSLWGTTNALHSLLLIFILWPNFAFPILVTVLILLDSLFNLFSSFPSQSFLGW